MAGANTTFKKASQEMQTEHQELMQKLSELDHALECLICYSEVFADLAGVQQAHTTARWMAGWLPTHFLREEQGILNGMSRLGPEFATFAREMKRQHKEIATRLEGFRKKADGFTSATDLQQSIEELKEEGKALASFVAAHMGAEERKYATLK
jgi:hypothetical protein